MSSVCLSSVASISVKYYKTACRELRRYTLYFVLLSISYCPHARALTDINDRGKVELPEQRSRAQPETVRGQPTFPRSSMSVNARVV